jgi:hypothetical protein
MLFEAIVLLTVSGALLSYQDFVYRRVNLLLLLLYTVTAIAFNFHIPSIWPPIIFASIGLIYWVWRRKQAFGWADYILVVANSFIIKDSTWPIFITCCGLYGTIFGIFCKETIPLVPVILLATVSTILCRCSTL